MKVPLCPVEQYEFPDLSGLAVFPTRMAFSNMSWSIRDQSDLENTLAKRSCISSSSRDVIKFPSIVMYPFPE